MRKICMKLQHLMKLECMECPINMHHNKVNFIKSYADINVRAFSTCVWQGRWIFVSRREPLRIGIQIRASGEEAESKSRWCAGGRKTCVSTVQLWCRQAWRSRCSRTAQRPTMSHSRRHETCTNVGLKKGVMFGGSSGKHDAGVGSRHRHGERISCRLCLCLCMCLCLCLCLCVASTASVSLQWVAASENSSCRLGNCW